ncbi:MAG TPA: diguanylate cyclase [Firmicutes bacterium]|nr:diguanylate cyclase [Bacillota bacterium]
MTFRLKLISIMIALGTIIIVVLTSFMALHNKRTLTENTLAANKNIAAAISIHIDNYLEELARTTKTLAASSLILANVRESNDYYESFSEAERQQFLQASDILWLEAAEPDDEFLQKYLANPVSQHLQGQEEVIPDLYGEIFLTNKYGGLIAATNKLTTFSHGYKYWWLAAYNNGKGKVFFDDRGYDTSVGDFVLGVTVPVSQNGEAIGILKSNMKILSLFDRIIESYSPLFEPGIVKIVRSGGQVVFEPEVAPLSTKLAWEIPEDASSTIYKNEAGKEMLASISPVKNTIESEKFSFGGEEEKSIDHLYGARGENWHVVLEFPLSVIEAQVLAQTKQFLSLGLFSLLFISLITYFIINRATNSLVELVKLTEEVGRGNLELRLQVKSKDEIGKLIGSFNNMVANLKETTASKEELAAEIEKRSRVEEELRHLSTVDELTGIYNRRAFNEEAGRLINYSKEKNQPLAVAMIDLDQFKTINDTYGHNTGDRILVEFTKLLTKTIGEENIFSRWGGDEFMVLMPNTDSPTAYETAEKFRAAVEKAELAPNVFVTVSIGVTELRKKDTFHDLLTRADNAQYRAKTRGKNSVQML